MPQLSRRFIKREVKERILDLFWDSFIRISNKNRAVAFLQDLLSKTEIAMISKRLAIAFLLTKGYDYDEIDELVKVSSATVSKVKLVLEDGQGYQSIVNQIIKDEKWDKFWNELEEVFQKILPPTPGTNWKAVRKEQWVKRRKNQKPF